MHVVVQLFYMSDMLRKLKVNKGLLNIIFVFIPCLIHAQVKVSQPKNELANKMPDSKYINRLLDQKMELLKEGIAQLINKKSSNLDQVVVNTFKLWNNDNSKTITVSTAKGGAVKSKKHVREYLKGLEKLPYKNASVNYGKYSVVSNIFKGPDGKYHGFIEFTQEFTAIANGENKTGKIDEISKGKVEVIIETIEHIDQNGKEKTMYMLFLGDMAIEEVR